MFGHAVSQLRAVSPRRSGGGEPRSGKDDGAAKVTQIPSGGFCEIIADQAREPMDKVAELILVLQPNAAPPLANDRRIGYRTAVRDARSPSDAKIEIGRASPWFHGGEFGRWGRRRARRWRELLARQRRFGYPLRQGDNSRARRWRAAASGSAPLRRSWCFCKTAAASKDSAMNSPGL